MRHGLAAVLLILVVSVVLVASGIASAAAAKLRVIGKASSRGDYAIAIASGNVDDPNIIKASITATPRQGVDGYWTMVCSRGLSAGSKSGSFTGFSPITKTLRMPMRNPDNCIVSVSGSLDDGGKVLVKILAG